MTTTVEDLKAKNANSLPGVTCDFVSFPSARFWRDCKCQLEFYEIYTSNVFQSDSF